MSWVGLWALGEETTELRDLTEPHKSGHVQVLALLLTMKSVSVLCI